jgi:predicted O-methyltransferase YrrM
MSLTATLEAAKRQVETVLQRLSEDPAQLRANWCVPGDAGRLLTLLTLLVPARRVLEVGTSIGYSGLWFGLGLLETDGQLITLDASAERIHQAQAHFAEAGLSERITCREGEARTLLQQLRAEDAPPFDLMFLDAHKADYIHYFEVAQTLVRPGGLLVADNTQSHREAMQPFLEAITHHSQWQWADLPTPNGVLIARKQAAPMA